MTYTPEENERFKSYLNMMTPNDKEFNSTIVEQMKVEGFEFVPVNDETAPSLGRKLARKIFGPCGIIIEVEASEDIVREDSNVIAMIALEAIESLQYTAFKDALYRANNIPTLLPKKDK